MVRRRPPRRSPRRVPGIDRMELRVLRALRRAHYFMETGQYEQAFPFFKRLAEGAAKRQMPLKAAQLYFQAARARLEMGGAQDAVELARRGMQLLTQAGQIERARAVLPRLSQALEEKGFHDQAVLLRAEIQALLGGGLSQPAAPPRPRPQLPATCPACNGPVHAGQVVWIDERSAECAYCGTLIRAT